MRYQQDLNYPCFSAGRAPLLLAFPYSCRSFSKVCRFTIFVRLATFHKCCCSFMLSSSVFCFEIRVVPRFAKVGTLVASSLWTFPRHLWKGSDTSLGSRIMTASIKHPTKNTYWNICSSIDGRRFCGCCRLLLLIHGSVYGLVIFVLFRSPCQWSPLANSQ